MLEQGQSFGGAIISLSQTISCFKKIDPLLITFMPKEASDPWVKGINHVALADYFNYKARYNVTRFCKQHIPSQLLQKLFFKGYALASLIGEILLAHKIARIGRKQNVRVVHCNNGVTYLAWRVAKIMKLPLVYHFRGVDWSNTYPEEVRLAASKYIAITRFLADDFSKRMSLPLERFSLIYDPVDYHVFEHLSHDALTQARVAMQAQEGDVIYLMAARIIPFKGQLEFLQCSLPLLLAHTHFKIALMGNSADESPAYFQRILDFIAEHQLESQITMLGFQADPAPFIKAADVIVHFSLGPEGFGRSVVEAWAAKKPIIATAIGGPIELIHDGEDGYLINPHDIEQCQDKITQLLTNSDLRNEIGHNGFARVLESFSQEKIAAALEAELLELIN
jgi:glycosyltransferase involved in cell wall biosynthesis